VAYATKPHAPSLDSPTEPGGSSTEHSRSAAGVQAAAE
jgi:hypothetical protein